MSTDQDYYRKRFDEESRRAQFETDSSVRRVHETLAKMYQNRLQPEEPEILRLRA